MIDSSPFSISLRKSWVVPLAFGQASRAYRDTSLLVSAGNYITLWWGRSQWRLVNMREPAHLARQSSLDLAFPSWLLGRDLLAFPLRMIDALPQALRLPASGPMHLAPSAGAHGSRTSWDDVFQALSATEVLVHLGINPDDGTIWLEHVPFGNVPPPRSQIDRSVLNYQAVPSTNATEITVLGSDSKLWYEYLSYRAATEGSFRRREDASFPSPISWGSSSCHLHPSLQLCCHKNLSLAC